MRTELVRTVALVGSTLVVLVSIAFVARLVPLLESPFFFGAMIAITVWLVTRYRERA